MLWLIDNGISSAVANLKKSAEDYSVDSSRLIFTELTMRDGHILGAELADIYLDTPYCSHISTGLDVLWAGVPLVTLSSESDVEVSIRFPLNFMFPSGYFRLQNFFFFAVSTRL